MGSTQSEEGSGGGDVSEVTVKGLDQLQKFLDQLPAKIEKNVMRGALRAGAKPVLAAAKANAPVATPSAENQRLYGLHSGALRDSIRISVSVKGGKVTAAVKAGKGDVYYARFVEYGTRAHKIAAANKGFLGFANRYYKSVEHPGSGPRPFMRPALDSQATAAVLATGEYIKKRLADKHGLDTSDIIIEVEE